MAVDQVSVEIKTDEDAWGLLSAWIGGEPIGEVTFADWPVLSINLKGDDYQSSLNSGQMSALVELKMVMGRALSLISHGSYDMRRLLAEEEEQLRFTTKVKRGSSILDTDFTPIVQAFSSAVSAHPSFSVIAAAIIGLALVARPVIVKYYDHRAKELDVEERKRLIDLNLSVSESEKYKIFEAALSKAELSHPQFSQIIPNARESFWRFVSASVDADKMNIAGLELSQDDIEILAERRRRKAGDPKSVTEVFKITSVRKAGTAYRIGLESKKLTFSALYRKPQLSEIRIKRLMNCFLNGDLIKAEVEVRPIEKAQVVGRLISFAKVEDPI
jgi:hypothetical protein